MVGKVRGSDRTIPLIRTSERGDFKSCQWKWYQRWVMYRTPQRVPTWAWFGGAMHVALSVRYQPGLKRASLADVLAAFDEALQNETRRIYVAGGELDEEEVVDARALGHAMLKGYVQQWKRDSKWHVVHNEQSFQIDVPNPRKKEEVLAHYCGTWDLVIWDTVARVYRVVDHKTRKTFPSDWSFYDINDQGGSYLWVAPEVLRNKGILTKKDVIDGIVFNCLKKAMPDDRPRNAQGEYLNMNGSVSLKQPGPMFHRYLSRREPSERVRQARKVIAEAQQMDLVRRGVLEMTKGITEDCVRCPFFEACSLDEQDPLSGEEYARSMFSVRDPYADHREAMADGGVRL